MSELPALVVAPDAPTELTATEQLLLDTGFHPSTARAFSHFDYEVVRSELHKQDLLAWLPREDRDRRIGMLVMRWRRIKPEAVRERAIGPIQETEVTHYALREEAPAPVQDELEPLELCDEEPLDPWTERARRLRPQWTSVRASSPGTGAAARAE